MAYSESKNFAVTRDDIITGAMRKIGVVDAADGASTAEISAAATSLNALVKEWTGEGLGLWLRQTSVLFLQPGQQRYSLGATDYCVPLTSVAYTTLSAAGAAAATALTHNGWTDYAGALATTPANPAIVLIRLSSGVMDSDVVSAATTSGLTLTTGLASAAASGARVYSFPATSIITRPARILTAYRQDTSGNSAEVQLIGRVDYEQLSRKDSSGDPTMAHYDPSLDAGTLMVWPVENATTCDQLILVTEHYPDDFDAGSNNPQFPIEWANALIWNLAMELSFEYGVDARTRTQVAQIAVAKKNTLFDTADRENASVTFAVGD